MFDISDNSERGSSNPGPARKPKRKAEYGSRFANPAKSLSVLSGLSHEMRTVMNAIVAHSFLLSKQGYSDEERERFSNKIYSSCDQIITLFDNFLDYAIIDTGNSKSDPGSCTIDETVSELFSEFNKKLKKNKQQDLIFVCEDRVNFSSNYCINSGRLARVIRNLFQIAVRNTNSGYIKAGYFFRDNYMTFYILDSGEGFLKCREFVHSDDLEQSISKYNDIYTAINLLLIKKILSDMDGSIEVTRNGFSGSNISFCIPVQPAGNIKGRVDKCTNTMSTF